MRLPREYPARMLTDQSFTTLPLRLWLVPKPGTNEIWKRRCSESCTFRAVNRCEVWTKNRSSAYEVRAKRLRKEGAAGSGNADSGTRSSRTKRGVCGVRYSTVSR